MGLLQDINLTIYSLLDSLKRTIEVERLIYQIFNMLNDNQKPSYANTYFEYNYSWHVVDRLTDGQLFAYAALSKATFEDFIINFQDEIIAAEHSYDLNDEWMLYEDLMSEHYYLDVSGWLYDQDGCIGNVLVCDIEQLLKQNEEQSPDLNDAIEILSSNVNSLGNDAERRKFNGFMQELRKRVSR